jgi:hypothetical protein
MAMFENQTLTRRASCPTHGDVTAEKRVPKLKFPFLITGIARSLAAGRPYRCPSCGAKAATRA